MQKWTTLPDPNGPALVVPAWASDSTRAIAADAAELFNATRAARAESDRLRLAVGDVDTMSTSIADLVGAAATARQSQLECLRSEIIARARFAEYLEVLERDRRQTEAESLAMIETARSDAKQRLIDAGCRDLSEAVNRHGKPDHDLRSAFAMVVNSYPAVGRAADQHREARSMGTALMERIQSNRRHQAETEAGLRKTLESLASLAAA